MSPGSPEEEVNQMSNNQTSFLPIKTSPSPSSSSHSYEKVTPQTHFSMEILDENQRVRNKVWVWVLPLMVLSFIMGVGVVFLFNEESRIRKGGGSVTASNSTFVEANNSISAEATSTTTPPTISTTPSSFEKANDFVEDSVSPVPKSEKKEVVSSNEPDACLGLDPILSLKDESSLSNLENGAVATHKALCSQIASLTLQKGGNAVDAAVTAALCLGVVNPANSGMGGGAFILLYSSKDPNDEKITEMIDCRETAPLQATYDMFEESSGSSTEGGLSIAILGELKGLELAHQRHGVLPWFDVVDPVIEIAEDGFEVSTHLALEIYWERHKVLRNPQLAKLLTKDNDGETLLEAGDVLKQPILANTLRKVRDEGADVLYKGPLAEALVQEVNEAGGIWTNEDLENYEAVIREPVIAKDVFGFNMVGAPPPSSGGATIIGAARFLSGYGTSISTFHDTLSQHRLVEAMKHVFAVRMSLSDPSFDDGNVTAEAVQDMIQGDYMETLRQMTKDDDVLPLSMYGGEKWAQIQDRRDGIRHERKLRLFQYLEDHGTSHFSVVDKDRNAVAMTSTVNTIFGSGIVSPSTGIVLNNEMDDFASPGIDNYFGLQPNPANYIFPGKRPLSSISPTLVFYPDPSSPSTLGKLFLSVGASGGPRIITATLQTFLNYGVLGMDLFRAVSHPRIHDQLLYGEKSQTLISDEQLAQGPTIQLSNRTKEALSKRGHDLSPTGFVGNVQAVAVDLETGRLQAVSDVRKDGSPAGY